MVYRFIDENKNVFGLRWLCKQFGISPNCYYNYKKDAKRKYYKRLARIFELIKYVYYNNNRIIGYRAMRIFIKRYGYEVSNTTMHKYMNKELYDMNIRVVNLNETNRRKKAINAYYIVNTHLPF